MQDKHSLELFNGVDSYKEQTETKNSEAKLFNSDFRNSINKQTIKSEEARCFPTITF